MSGNATSDCFLCLSLKTLEPLSSSDSVIHSCSISGGMDLKLCYLILLLLPADYFVYADGDFLHGWINITAEPGKNVTLPCRGSDHRTIIVVEWSRTDLGSEYVLRYRDQQLDPENQNPSFRNRVDLLDPQMKAGDVSVVLKNLTTDDRGTYECRVIERGTRRRKRGSLKTRPVSSVVLDVVPSGSEDESREDGSVGLLVGLPVIIIAAAAVVVGLMIYRRPGSLQQLYGPPAHQTAPEH